MMSRPALYLVLPLLSWLAVGHAGPAFAEVIPLHFEMANRQCMKLELLRADIVHVEYGDCARVKGDGKPIGTSPYVMKTNYAGAAFERPAPRRAQTDALTVEVDAKLCLTIRDRARSAPLAQLCPGPQRGRSQELRIRRTHTQNVYGLGQQFVKLGQTDGDWLTHGARTPGDEFGNQMTKLNGGANGNTQFPILYAVGEESSYALFLDNIYQQTWRFERDPWTVRMSDGPVRFYVFVAPRLADLRTAYMQLVGHPLIPPKKAFGLWVSEYGFENWQEVASELEVLRAKRFPVDGFVMDLQWFGGVTPDSDQSAMGRLTWDEKNFPAPKEKVASLAEDHLGLILIEESYVARGLEEHDELAAKKYLAHQANGAPIYLQHNPWWGKGGLIDWSHPQGAKAWHDGKRQPLIDMGIMGHWTDLGEPEVYLAEGAIYHGVEPGKTSHADIHNIYNLLWHQSIHDGYQRHNVKQRPFLLTRSGGPGIQRYGAAMWSGDIASKLSSLATHLNVQSHMSLSGIDYFGSDVGGFFRKNGDENAHDMYTKWFADSAWIDVPVRPHTLDLENQYHTNPAVMGDVASNLANLRQRYELIPYYYSLAYRAHLAAEPVIPPPVYYYQDDARLRLEGNQKMIGPHIMVATLSSHGDKPVDVYLPKGTWYDYYTNSLIESRGQWHKGVSLYREKVLRVPAYVRAGAILPKAIVTESTKDSQGHGLAAWQREAAVLRVYTGGPGRNAFELYEDDGATRAYLDGAFRVTEVAHEPTARGHKVEIAGARGTYAGAPAHRVFVVELVARGRKLHEARLDGTLVRPGEASAAEAKRAQWQEIEPGVFRVQSAPLPTDQAHAIEVVWQEG